MNLSYTPSPLCFFLAALVALPHALFGQSCPTPAPLTPPWLSYPALPFRHVALTESGARAANVYMMDIGTGLGRPFVFVEGIDFGLGGTNSEFQLGDFGWAAFNGCSPDQYPMMAQMPVLLDSLLERGFHPILIDFESGAGDIFANAELLADILVHINGYKNDDRPIVLSGASMGGQIARIALRMMENEGLPHCAQLYLSLDSPHRGANIPIGLQQIIGALNSSDGNVATLYDALSEPAARQLLLKQTLPLYPRAHYQDSLDALGWPQWCRNIGIANGALGPVANSNQPLLDFEYAILSSEVVGDIGGLLDLEIHADPGSLTHPLAAPLYPVTSLLEVPSGSGWPWPLDLNVGHDQSGTEPWGGSLDVLPGGTRPSLRQFVEAFNVALEDMTLPWPLQIPAIESDDYQPLHSFIPTGSALGVSPPWAGLTAAQLVTGSPFDGVHFGEVNEPHSEVNPANIAFVLSQLDFTECPIPPGDLLGETALNADGDWFLPALHVLDRLCLQSADPTFGAAAAAPNSHGIFELQRCPGFLSVAPNASLELGGGTASDMSTAQLTVRSGSTLLISGQLTLHPGSELVIESGATLQISGGMVDQRPHSTVRALPGSLIQADGQTTWAQAASSQLYLDANMALAAHCQWQHHLFPQARIWTTHECRFELLEAAAMSMQSLEAETHWVIQPDAAVRIEGLGTWHQDHTGMRLLGGALWESNLSELVRFDDAQWTGTEGDSVHVCGPMWLRAHHASAVNLKHTQGECRMEHSSFQGGSTHLAQNKVRWRSCAFVHHPVVHTALGEEPAHLIENCHFQGAETGLSARGPGRLRLEECVFDGHVVGLKAQTSRLELACNTFTSNDIGLASNKALLVMRPEGGGGWNRFEDNDVHLKFQQAPFPELMGGANHFGHPYSGWATGSINTPCNGGGLDWLIDGQSWDWPTGWPQIQSGLWAWNSDGVQNCPIAAIDMAPITPKPCGEGRKERRE